MAPTRIVPPLDSPHPNFTPPTAHPSSSTLQAVHVGNRYTVAGALIALVGLFTSGATAIGVAYVNAHAAKAETKLSSAVDDQLPAMKLEQALMQQKLEDVRVADQEAHDRIEKAQREGFDHLELVIKAKR